MSTTIILRRIKFEGRHGATAVERRSTRPFEVDVELHTTELAAELTDRLPDTVDYSAVAKIIVDLGSGEPHRLLESLARRMVDRLFEAAAPAQRIRLELRKLSPPGCPGDPDHSAVRLDRTR